MSEFDDNSEIIYEDEITTTEEQIKIEKLKIEKVEDKKKSEIICEKKIDNTNLFSALSAALGGNAQAIKSFLPSLLVSNPEPVKIPLARRFGIHPKVNINNISGKRAWVILSPAPIKSVSSVGIEKLGSISFSTDGSYKCQEYSLANNISHDFELDNSQIYYTVFFDCDGKWKTPYKNRKINTKKYDINLLERHVNDAIEYNFISN